MKRAWARLKVHWVRHLLAAVQVAIGVAVVSAVLVDVVPVLRSAGESESDELFYAYYGNMGLLGGFESSAFVLEDVEYLLSEADSVVAASVFDTVFAPIVRAGGDLFAVRGVAEVNPGLAELLELPLLAGRFFTAADAQAAEPEVALISEGLASLLFPDGEAIGQTINLRPEDEARRFRGLRALGAAPSEGAPGLDLRVVGVFAYPADTPEFGGFFTGSPRAEILIPATGHIAPSLVGPVSPPPGLEAAAPGAVVRTPRKLYSRIYFRAAEGRGDEAVAEAEALLAARLEERASTSGPRDDSGSLQIEPAEGAAAFMARAQLQGALVLGTMGVVAMIVSGFSVFTTFLASVAERVRAIGLARSLGATRLRILREIVGEAVALSAFGGLIGVVLGFPVRRFALAPLLSTPTTPPSFIDYLVVALAGVLMAAAIGALASLYPGWTVARMMPSEAFHEE